MKHESTASKSLDNLFYDWVAILHHKAKGLAAYDTYMEDARSRDASDCIQMFERLREEDERQVREIRSHMVKMISSGFMEDTSEGIDASTGRAAFDESQASH